MQPNQHIASAEFFVDYPAYRRSYLTTVDLWASSYLRRTNTVRRRNEAFSRLNNYEARLWTKQSSDYIFPGFFTKWAGVCATWLKTYTTTYIILLIWRLWLQTLIPIVGDFVILRLCVQNNTEHPYISIWQVLAVMFKYDSLSCWADMCSSGMPQCVRLCHRNHQPLGRQLRRYQALLQLHPKRKKRHFTSNAKIINCCTWEKRKHKWFVSSRADVKCLQ